MTLKLSKSRVRERGGERRSLDAKLKKEDRRKNEGGPDRGSNPEPLAPKARIIPLDHQATVSSFGFI